MSRLYLCLVLTFVFVAGCNCKSDHHGSNIVVEEGNRLNDIERQQETLDRNLTLLNSLEEYPPSLPEMPGAEKLIQASDRLNKWIADRPADPNWKPDESLQTLEKATKRCEEVARDVVQLLRVLQGKDEGVPKGNHEPKTLDVERKQIATRLSELNSELKEFAKRCEVPNLDSFSKSITDLQKNFTNLDSIPNLTPAKVRAFAKQWENETNQFERIAEDLEDLATQFRVDGLFIQPSDVEYLKQCTWTRNISNWARGDKQTTLDRVKSLFDWTVRNIEIRDSVVAISQQQAIALPQQFPWQSLLLGKSTAWDRAWVFMELLRQQRIDSCVLTIPHPVDPKTTLGWAVGVLIDNELYLFLPFHGLPIPGPGGLAFKENGELDCKDIATFSQIIKDDKLLRKLDISDADKFPLTAESAKQSIAHILVTPFSVSLRMKTLEAELSGEQNMVLYSDPKEQRRLFGSTPGIKGVELWMYPFRTMFEQLFSSGLTNELMREFQFPNPKKNNFGLWSGRILYFKGKITGQDSAVMGFQDARIPDRDMMELRQQPLFQANPALEQIYHLITMRAIYWLGIASYETDSLDPAKDYFDDRELRGRNPWNSSIQCWLGRIAERNKKYDDAVNHYGRATEGPSVVGCLLRVKWLKETAKK